MAVRALVWVGLLLALLRGVRAIPQSRVLTNSTAAAILRKLSTPRGEVLFTTTGLPPNGSPGTVDMLDNFCYHLEKIGMLKHALILTPSESTWRILEEKGMPVYLDRALPYHDRWLDPATAPPGPNREFDIEKYWWGYKMASLGFKTLYIDADAVALRDPFAAFKDQEWDVQGLSDWDDLLDTPTGEEILRGCHLYKWVRDDKAPKGTLLRKSWGADRATQLEPISIPCQSTGLFYLQPRPNVERFMLALVDRLVREETWHEWDQATWNVVIVPFLIGSGDSDLPPLRYRLLPHAEYANIHVVERRRQAGKRADVVIMHLGGVHGRDKSKAYANAGLWHINERPALPAPQSGGFVGAQGWGAASAAAVAGSLVVAGIVFRYRRTSRHPTSPHKSQV